VRFYGGARQSQFFAVRFSMDARQLLHTNGWAPQPNGLLTGVKLCRAPWKNARQRQDVCRAFSYGARQSYSIAVRFALAHGNVFLKIEFSHLISIFPPQVYYFALYISIIYSYLYFC
jgi:hypothetical protein